MRTSPSNRSLDSRLGPIRLAAIWTALSVAAGCGKKDAPDTTTAATPEVQSPVEAADAGETPRPRRDPEPTAPTAPTSPGSDQVLEAEVLTKVPAEAPVVFLVRPQAVLDAVGFKGLMEKHAALVAEVTSPLVQAVGFDPTDLSAWAGVGVDLAGVAGAWTVDLRPSGVVTFLTLSDRKALEGHLQTFAKKAGAELSSEAVGGNTLYTLPGGDRAAVLVGDKTLYGVMLYRGTGAAEVARAIAGRGREASLAGKAGFTEKVKAIASPHGAVVFRFGELVAREVEKPDWLKGTRAGVESQLEEAKKGGDKARIDELTRELANAIEYENRWVKRLEAEQALMRHFYSGLGEVVAGLSIGPDGLDVEARLPITGEAALASLVKPADGVVPILKAFGTPPLLVAGGQLDVAEAMKLIAMISAADGEDFGEIKAELGRRTGLDLDKELVAQLDGRVGFALTGDLLAALQSGEPESKLGGAYYLGVKDGEAVKALLKKVAGLPFMAELGSFDEATSAFTGKLPGGPAGTIAVAGNLLVISTDAEVGKRLTGEATFLDSGANPLLKARLTKPGLGAVFTMEQAFVGAWLFVGAGGRSRSSGDLGEETEETKKIRAELEKLEEEISVLRNKVEQARMQPLLDGLTKLGSSAYTLRVGQGELELSLGMYTRQATLAEAVAQLIDYGIAEGGSAEPSEDEKRLRELENKRWELESQLWKKAAPPVEEESPHE